MIWIAGVRVANPASIKPSEFDLSKSERMADGTMTMDIIATKRRVDVTWDKISDGELDLILSTIAANKPFFSFRCPAPGGWLEMTCYAGDRGYGYWRKIDGVVYWHDISIAFIEQ
jgi:hypothetical protein